MSSQIIFRYLTGTVVIGALGTTCWFATRPPPLTIQGEVSSDRVDVTSRIVGRVEKLNVNAGDAVKRSAP